MTNPDYRMLNSQYRALVDDKLVGVLDIDSPALDRFSASDQEGIELLCRTFGELLTGRDNFI